MPLRCFRRRYWKYCTKGMRTVLYNMLGCESFISRSFRPFPRGGEQKTMIVFSFLNSGCERRGGWYGKQGGNGWATGPSFLQKSCKKAVKFIISRLFVVDLIGIEPTTLRMRTVRSRKVVSFLPTDCGVWFDENAGRGADARNTTPSFQ